MLTRGQAAARGSVGQTRALARRERGRLALPHQATTPNRLAGAYRDAITGLKAFDVGSVRKQLLLYRQLTANVDAALALSNWGESIRPAPVAAPPLRRT